MFFYGCQFGIAEQIAGQNPFTNKGKRKLYQVV